MPIVSDSYMTTECRSKYLSETFRLRNNLFHVKGKVKGIHTQNQA